MIDSFSGQYEFLSNFYPCQTIDDGIKYRSLEHSFQAAKTPDKAEKRKIAACATPGRAKRMGRKMTLRPDWEAVKVDVMIALLEKKFRDPGLRQQLLDTGEEELIEGNTWHDQFWGVSRRPGPTWDEGENMLGKILMALRETYKQEQ